MRIRLTKHVKAVLVVSLFMLTFYVWTRPLNGLPFGDVDTPVHFTAGDYMGQTDKVFLNLPYYFQFRVGDDAKGKMPYPPQYATNEAIFQKLTGSRFDGVYLYIAFGAVMFVFGWLLLITELFGFMPAFMSSLMLAFSARHYLTYIWGQWPQTLSFSFIPVTLYCFYKYTQDRASRYLAVLVLLFAFQYTFHPQGVLVGALFVVAYSVLLGFKKKWLVGKKEIVAAAALVVLMGLLAPYQARVSLGQLGIVDTGRSSVEEGGIKLQHLGSLFQWYPSGSICEGCVSPEYFSFKEMHNGWWTLPFIFVGAVFLLARRKPGDLFFLTFAVPVYLLMHLSVFNVSRAHRFFPLEAELFYPLVAIGFLGIASFAKMPKWAGFGVFCVAVLFIAAPSTFNDLSQAYGGVARITPTQLAAAEWMQDNLPEDAHVLLIGVLTPAKSKWMSVLGFRHGIYDYQFWGTTNKDYNLTDYVLLDYSDYATIGRQDILGVLQQYEKKMLAEKKLLYDQGGTKIYAVK